VRDEHYGLMRGLFHGAGDESEAGDSAQPRLHSVTLAASAHAVGMSVAELRLEESGAQVKAVRRAGEGKLAAAAGLRLEANDVVVLLGVPEALAAAEIRLLQG
jgi:CPA2 family monovalent cation:H+ antiporter-2